MRSQTTQNVAGGIPAYYVHGESKITAIYRKQEDQNSQRYLKFWENDYPYLKGNRINERRCLPIAENSEAQRLLRNFNSTLQFK